MSSHVGPFGHEPEVLVRCWRVGGVAGVATGWKASARGWGHVMWWLSRAGMKGRALAAFRVVATTVSRTHLLDGCAGFCMIV